MFIVGIFCVIDDDYPYANEKRMLL